MANCILIVRNLLNSVEEVNTDLIKNMIDLYGYHGLHEEWDMRV